jgi:nucleotide-binding universal stress UspA family protein
MPEFHSIVHPTDFSELSMTAFAHALKIALITKGRLDIVHIASKHDRDADIMPPRVRHVLAVWGLAKESESLTSIGERLNIKVSKIELPPQDASEGIVNYLRAHPGELVVLATEGRDGVMHLLKGSVAETIALRSGMPTLFLNSEARGFLDQWTGEVHLNRVLVPVDHDPEPRSQLKVITDFVRLFGDPELRLMHVGTTPPSIPSEYRTEGMGNGGVLRSGNPVDAILKEASAWGADLVAMPSAGHQTLRDSVMGSTSERVLRNASCPVLKVPSNGALSPNAVLSPNSAEGQLSSSARN